MTPSKSDAGTSTEMQDHPAATDLKSQHQEHHEHDYDDSVVLGEAAHHAMLNKVTVLSLDDGQVSYQNAKSKR